MGVSNTDQTMNLPVPSRRQALVGAAAVAAASALIAQKPAQTASNVGGINAIPPLAPHWSELDLAEILSRPLPRAEAKPAEHGPAAKPAGPRLGALQLVGLSTA